MKQAFIYFTRSIGRHNRRELSALVKDLAGVADVFALSYDAKASGTGYVADECGVEGLKHVVVRRGDLSELFSSFPRKYSDSEKWGIMPGNLDLAQMACSQLIDAYDNYWFCEDDVRYSGAFSDLLSECKALHVPLLATNVRPMPESWPHLPDLPDELVVSLRAGKTPVCFLPFFRVTPDFLAALKDVYTAGLYGHHEAVWPYVAAGMGSSVADFRQVRKSLYTGKMKNNRLSAGTFVYRPPKLFWGSRRQTLYHPVKPPMQFVKSTVANLKHRVSLMLEKLL